jgi:hypothetical protein
VSHRWAAAAASALVGCCCATPAALTPAALAQPASTASFHPSFAPDRLGAGSALTLSFRFSGGEEGVPAPLTGMVVRLPAGLSIDLRGVTSCAKSRLQSRGASGCASTSLLGRGHAQLEVHAGSQILPEESTISVFRGPNHGSQPTFEIFGQGETPLDESATSTAILGSDNAPYGSKLTVSIPPIPTVVYEPNASFTSMSLTVGGVGRGDRARPAPSIVLPHSCPAQGFPFAASFTFADGSTATAEAAAPCPR